MLVLPIIIGNDIERFLRMSIGSMMINNPAPHSFGPWTDFAILALALGTILLVRRNA